MEKSNPVIEIPQEFRQLFEPWWSVAVIEGGRYSLKSHTLARVCLIKAMQQRSRIACLRQFQRNIGDSSYQLLADLIVQYGLSSEFSLTQDSIKEAKTQSNFIFKGLDRNVETTIKSLEGIDFAWVDEAQTITKKSIQVLDPTLRKENAQLVFTLNRLTDLDPVLVEYITNPERDDVLHLQLDYHIAEKNGWLTDRIKKKIEYSRIHSPEDYAHIYLGKALNQSDKSILSVSRVLDAMNREADDTGAEEVGVDVARMGNDRTEFVKRKGMRETGRKTYTKLRTTEVCDKLEAFVDYNKLILIKIDDTGLGGGVTDEMLKRGYNIMPLNFGSKAVDSDKYPNLISEAWFYLQKVIDDISIANNRDLLTELSSREWKMDSHGRRGVESKDDYKKRGFRSPDLADATILCFYTPEVEVVERSTSVV